MNGIKSKCGEVPMTQWAGQACLRQTPLPLPVGLVVIQHTVYGACASDEECAAVAKAIRNYHMKQGYDDIGQSFLVGGNGEVYEGAGWRRVGAHTRGLNNRSVALSFMGDFRETLPTPQALQAAKDFLACASENKLLREDYRLVGHRQVSQTESPGAALQKEITTWPHWLEMANI
ncbi:hypothetical protein MSG28_003020 [Choristoneura fumiferana]|uniref:Uncharacterized protein n=1 Tax=Choristoneura fumiferana TaxID=7141 RepID=A0ACC0JKB5_CHOFU|nr:hypothetical protein MSG28_003020 [Choristoneura fumiferana]